MKVVLETSIRVGDLINGKEITRIEDDPFIDNQVNLFTNEQVTNEFGDMEEVVFRVRKY